jgi:hypothetical protein
LTNIEFEEIYQQTVSRNIKDLEMKWDLVGKTWLDELSGGIMPHLTGIKFSDYRRFDEMSGEEQYAFYCWLKQEQENE